MLGLLNANRTRPRLAGGAQIGVLIVAFAMMMTKPSCAVEPTPASAGSTQRATLGGGCFWCIEAVFEQLPGVKSVVSGYAGGRKPNPTYREVCSGSTGHAEAVQIEFDPSVISYQELLAVFWQAHDPTTLNRQGPDMGTQYRSIIFYHDEAQRMAAAQSKAEAAARLGRVVVTELVPFTVFYPAEPYHQDFYRNNPQQPYCRAYIQPKLEKLKQPSGKGLPHGPRS